MTYRTEFPDFDPATMPAIPADWRDTSWRNETCPCFATKGLSIFVDYVDPEQREFPECERFTVHDLSVNNTEDSVLYYSDDWAAVLAFVEGFNA